MKNVWDINAIVDGYVKIAEASYLRLKEVRKKRSGNSSYEILFTHELAKYTLYNHLCNKVYCENKDILKKELHRLINEQIEPSEEIYNRDEYKHSFESEVCALIKKYK